MEKIKALAKVSLKETMFGVGPVEIKANVISEIPKEAYEAWKARGYAIDEVSEGGVTEVTGEDSVTADNDDGLFNVEYNDLKARAKELNIDLPRSIKKPDLIALIRTAREDVVEDAESE